MKSIREMSRNVRNRYYAAQGAIAAAAAFSPVVAFAQATDLGAAVKTEVEGGKTAVNAILLVLAGVLGLFILWSMIKRAK